MRQRAFFTILLATVVSFTFAQTDVTTATCAEVLAGTDGVTYRVTGTVDRILSTEYGNCYIKDETGEIYIYGTNDRLGNKGTNPINGENGWDIEIGDEITVEGPRFTYIDLVELVDVSVVNYKKNNVKLEGKGSLANPFTAKEAIDYIATLEVDVESDTYYFISGVVSYIDKQFDTQSGDATFTISDEGQSGNYGLAVTQAYYLGNTLFSGGDLLVSGDKVIVCGRLVYSNQGWGFWTKTVSHKTYLYSLEKSNTITIDEEHFPDENFRNYLLNYTGYGSDGFLTQDELSKMDQLKLYDRSIKDLTGIEYFKELTYLDCAKNKLTSLSLANHPKLQELYCNDNLLTSLDLSNCSELKEVSCFNNKIKQLNVSGCHFLTSLQCWDNEIYLLNLQDCEQLKLLGCNNNQLTALNVTNNMQIESLWCSNNQLVELDVSNHTQLSDMVCANNQLRSLIVSNTSLKQLDCYNNQLTSLDVSSVGTLQFLLCNNNQLSTIDFSKNIDLSFVRCYNNLIKNEGMDLLIASLLPTNNYKELELVDVDSESEGNVCTKSQVSEINQKGWVALDRNRNVYEGSEYGIAIDETNFPDEKFREYLLEQDYGQDGLLTEEEISGITSLGVGGLRIKNLQGLEFFTELRSLSCEGNRLSSLDVSKNTKLTDIYCADNYLTALDVSNNVALTSLQCWNNQIETLNVSNCKDMILLHCQENALTSLDLSGLTSLTNLQCEQNKLTSLDLSNNAAIEYMFCHSNKLTSLNLQGCTKLLSIYCQENELASLSVAGCDKLWELDCYDNQLTTLDLSGCTLMMNLLCYNNQFTTLDVADCKELENLSCYGNKIKEEAMDALISSLPYNDTKAEFPFVVFDETNSDEGNVCTKAQVAAAKERGWTPYYMAKWKSLPVPYEGSEPSAISPVRNDGARNSAYFQLDGKTGYGYPTKKGVYIIGRKKVVVQ